MRKPKTTGVFYVDATCGDSDVITTNINFHSITNALEVGCHVVMRLNITDELFSFLPLASLYDEDTMLFMDLLNGKIFEVKPGDNPGDSAIITRT